MKNPNLLQHVLGALPGLVFFATIGPLGVSAQAPPGPLPQTAPQGRSSLQRKFQRPGPTCHAQKSWRALGA